MTSPRLMAASNSTRTEEQVRAARRQRLAADLRAEGANDATVARLTDDATVDRLVKHERQVMSLIASLFEGHS